jgi:hypothetical protein
VRTIPGYAGAFWPEPDDELLLLAALGDDERSSRAWATLGPRFELDAVQWPQYRLMPLLGRNLARQAIDAPGVRRMLGVRRRTWSENQLLLRDAEQVLSLLTEAGVSALALKGLALLTAYYDDVGLRPMRDIDLLVDDRPRALEVLADAGWSPRVAWRREPVHGLPMKGPTGIEVDVHAGLSGLALRRHADRSWDDFWSASTPTTIGTAPVRLPDAAELLVHVCVHGARRHDDSSLQWVADATTILSTATVDWDRLVRHAQQRRAVIPLRETLRYVSSLFAVDVPGDVLDRLADTRTTPRDRIVFRAHSGAEFGAPSMRLPSRAFWNYARVSAERTLPRAILGVPAHAVRRLRSRLSA